MADVFTRRKRSEVMSAIRSKGNKETEVRFAVLMKQEGITGWRRHLPLPGRPDYAFRRERLAVFVDGCFWHGCPKHLRMPASNQEYWQRKILRNQTRDKEVVLALRKKKWRVLRFWAHDLRNGPRAAARLRKALDRVLAEPQFRHRKANGKTQISNSGAKRKK